MPAFDPYAVLGVKKNAKPGTIRGAYRVRAKSAHPDQGGSSEEFARLKLAHDILMDPNRRAKYDATGHVDETAADNAMAAILSELAYALDAALGGLAPGIDAERVDLAGIMKQKLRDKRADIHRQVEPVRKANAAFGRLLGRFSVKKGPNHLENMIMAKIAHTNQSIANADQALSNINKALDFMETCSWRYDVMQAVSYSPAWGIGGFPR